MKAGLKPELASMGRFGLVGLASCATYVAVALLAESAGLAPQAANLAGVLASTALSFVGHALYSFAKGGITRAYLLRFCALSAAVYGLTYLATYVGVTLLGWPRTLVVLGIAAIIPVFTWTAGRFWVFR